MVLLQAQVSLTGEKLEYEKDRVETWKDIIKGKYFQLTVSEDQHSKIDGWHENGKDVKIRTWLTSSMRPYQTLPEGSEGEMFQADLELFVRIL